MAAYNKNLLRLRYHEDVPRMQLKMHVSVRMDECDSLADVEKIADESGKRYTAGFVFTVKLQPPDVRSLDVWLREERLAILGCAQVVQRNKIRVAKPGPQLGHLKKPLVVIRAVRKVDNDFPSQGSVEGKPPAMWPIEPQL